MLLLFHPLFLAVLLFVEASGVHEVSCLNIEPYLSKICHLFPFSTHPPSALLVVSFLPMNTIHFLKCFVLVCLHIPNILIFLIMSHLPTICVRIFQWKANLMILLMLD